ncbi:hypothetical protein [Carnobacterium sp.]|uniref:hypothetical protein n=1 Tax=Carnobacterium sp. TaxID=48221 RepID=UPI002FC8D123
MKFFKKLILLALLSSSTLLFSFNNVSASGLSSLEEGQIIQEESVPPLNDNQIYELFGPILDSTEKQVIKVPIYVQGIQTRVALGAVILSQHNSIVSWSSGDNIVGMNGSMRFSNITNGSIYNVGVRGSYGSIQGPKLKGHTIVARLDATVTFSNGQTGSPLIPPVISYKIK